MPAFASRSATIRIVRATSASVLNISAMSFGALSANAILALNGGDLVWEIGSCYFGCSTVRRVSRNQAKLASPLLPYLTPGELLDPHQLERLPPVFGRYWPVARAESFHPLQTIEQIRTLSQSHAAIARLTSLR